MTAIVEPEVIDLDAVRPSVDDVAMLMRTRTIDTGDQELTTFTDDTRPTNYEVEVIIDNAVDEVLSQIPDRVFPQFYPQIKRLATLLTAVKAEASFYREQTATGPVGVYQGQYTTALTNLQPLLRSGIVL